MMVTVTSIHRLLFCSIWFKPKLTKNSVESLTVATVFCTTTTKYLSYIVFLCLNYHLYHDCASLTALIIAYAHHI